MVASNTSLPNYKKILVPHDGTEMSDKSRMHAASLALLSNGEVTILSVVDEYTVPPSTLLAFFNEKGLEMQKKILGRRWNQQAKDFRKRK